MSVPLVSLLHRKGCGLDSVVSNFGTNRLMVQARRERPQDVGKGTRQVRIWKNMLWDVWKRGGTEVSRKS